MILQVSARWRAAILVCGKCERKLGKAGFGQGEKQRLSKLLAKRAGSGKGREARLGIVSAKCLKICPKGAVTVVNGSRPRDWLVVKAGTPVELVESRLGLGDPPVIAAD